MIRLIAFLAVVLGLAAGFSWIADRPGEVRMVWLGHEIVASVLQIAVGLVALVVAAILIWSVLTGLWRTPQAVGAFMVRRRREKGWRALSQGMIAVGAGDAHEAARLAVEARKILGNEPLALLLDAQSAQARGDFAAARTTFERMLEVPETKLLGLRGLYVEANREGAAEAAQQFAEQASATAPRLAWAGDALINFQAGAGDWEAALVTLERSQRHKGLDKAEAQRLKAVLLTARGQDLEPGHPDMARAVALEAQGLAPDLVPAALIAARLLVRNGDIRRASRILEASWKQEPHPDVAEAYAYLRPGDSALDRLGRVRDLLKVRGQTSEGSFALARAQLAARDFTAARATLQPLIDHGATRRTCLLMAEIDEAEFGASASVREWLTRAVRAPRDPQWLADGQVLDAWAPVAPVSGRLGAVTWGLPPERGTFLDADVVERLADASVPAPVVVVAPAAAAKPKGDAEDAEIVVPRPDDPGPGGDINGQERRPGFLA